TNGIGEDFQGVLGCLWSEGNGVKVLSYNGVKGTNNAFLVTADVPKIYMQKFWATATVHHHSIRFKMNNKKRIVNPEYFRERLQICPRIPNQ
nr:hypothetical protein [Tanacetum cinerariifolium]